eukprot:3023837-Prymnesium_polylepis.1
MYPERFNDAGSPRGNHEPSAGICTLTILLQKRRHGSVLDSYESCFVNGTERASERVYSHCRVLESTFRGQPTSV